MDHIESSVYKINTANGTGTGFYHKENDLIITNYHVVAGCSTVSLEGKDKNRYLTKVVYVNPGKDIAFLRANDLPKPIDTVVIDHHTESRIRDKVIVLGYPYGMPFTVTEGIVSNPRQSIGGQYYIQTDAAINPGNSGGPVINEKGELMGIVTSKFSDADNMGFAIPMETLREKTDYCPNCGTNVDENLFDEMALSDFSLKVEEAITRLRINPVLARSGRERWYFHQGSAEIRMFVYDTNYLFATSPLNNLPRKNLAEIYEYILTADMGPHRLSISDNQIYLSYRIHISDLYSDHKNEILECLAQLATKADELDNIFVNDFGAEMTHYSK